MRRKVDEEEIVGIIKLGKWFGDEVKECIEIEEIMNGKWSIILILMKLKNGRDDIEEREISEKNEIEDWFEIDIIENGLIERRKLIKIRMNEVKRRKRWMGIEIDWKKKVKSKRKMMGEVGRGCGFERKEIEIKEEDKMKFLIEEEVRKVEFKLWEEIMVEKEEKLMYMIEIIGEE